MMNETSRTFPPDTMHLLCEAFDEAWERLGCGGNGAIDVERNDLAKHIIALATKAERDRKRLVNGALAAATPQRPKPLVPSPDASARTENKWLEWPAHKERG